MIALKILLFLVSRVMVLFFLLDSTVRLFKLYAVLINYYTVFPYILFVDEPDKVLFYACLRVACTLLAKVLILYQSLHYGGHQSFVYCFKFG